MSYYRVMLTNTGELHSCIEVPKAEYTGSLRVYFLEACDQTIAVLVAQELHREEQRQRQKARRHRYISAGRCPDCGGKPKRPHKHCQECLDKVARAKERKSGKLKTLAQPKSVALAVTRRKREDEVRLALIQTLWKALCDDKVDVYEWLKAKRESLLKRTK